MIFLMLRRISIIILSAILVFSFQIVKAEDLKPFLRSCGYGTLIGAGIGLASLVFEKKPNESYSNIARGASLGLYAGIGVGLFMVNNPSSSGETLTWQEPKSNFFIAPDFTNQSLNAFYSYRFGSQK